MRKNFLLVFLLGLFPLMGWATEPVGTGKVTGKTGLVYKTGGEEQVLLNAITAPNNHGTYDKSYGKVMILVKDNATVPIKSNTDFKPYSVGDVPADIVGTDAKTYHVFYYFTNDGTVNYDEDENTIRHITVAIGRKTASAADGDFTAPTVVTGLVFDNTEKTIVEATKPESGHFLYQYRQQTTYNQWTGWNWSGWSGWSETLPTGTNARNYQIRYRYINEDGNYNDWNTSTYQTITASIDRATWGEGAAIYTAPKQKEDAIFNNTNQTMVTPGEVPTGWGAEMQYGTTNWRNTVEHNDFRSTNVMAANRTVYYRIQGGNGYNWNALAQTPIEGGVNILPADAPDATGGALAASPLTYTGADQQLVATGYTVTLLSGTAQVRYYVNGADKGTAIAGVTAKDQGEYEITYTLDYNNAQTRRNYKPVDPAKSLGTVKIDKVKLTIAGVGFSKDFDNTAFEATPENVVKLVDGIGWLGSETDAQKAEILGALLEVKSGLPQINVGSHKVELQSKEDPNYSYVIDPMFHETADLNILKIDNTWKNDVSIAATWPYGSAPAAPSAEPNLTKKENGEDAVITYKYYTDDLCTTEFTGDIDETMPVGVYYVKAFVEGCNNFFPLESVTAASFEITATSPTWTKAVAMAGWEYGQYSATDNAPIAEAIDDATITFKYYEDYACTTEIAAEDLAALGVGKYYVKAFAAATANHTADENGPAEFEVTPTTLPDFGISEVEAVYNAENQNPGADKINAAIKEKTGLVAGTDYELSFDPADGVFINVGKYYGYVTGKGNYAKKDAEGNVNSQTVEFTIKQAEVPLGDIIAAEAKNLTYTAADQVLAEEAAIKDGSILVGDFWYAEGETAPVWNDADTEHKGWTKGTVPSGYNAGDYTVWTKFVPSQNFVNNVEITSIPAKIEQAQLKITLTNTFEKTWNGLEIQADQLEETYVIDGLLGDDAYVIPFTLTLPATEDNNFIDAKVYELKKLNITWTDENVQNYKIAFTTVGSVTINKADIETTDFEAPVAYDNLTYTGAAQELVEEGVMITKYNDKFIGSFLYYQGDEAPAEDSEDWQEAIPTATKAGDYPVWYMVKGDANHNNYVAEKALAGKIAGFDLEDVDIAISEDAVYNKTNQKPEYTLTYKVDAKTTLTLVEGTDFDVKVTNKAGEEVTEFINADEYTFTFTAVQDKDGNYTGNYTGTNSATYTIDQFEVIAEALPTSKVYNGLVGKELRADETYANGKTEIVVKYGGLFTGDEDAISAEDAIIIDGASKNVGDYEIVLKKDAFVSQNYKIKEVTGAIFSITPAALTINWNDADPGFSKVYGEDDPPLTATIDNLVIEGAGDGDEDDIIANTVITRAKGENVGKYGITLSAYKDDKGNIAPVFKNYTFATPFDTADEAFAITEAGVKVSIAPQYVTFTGKTAVIEVTADKLVITGLENEDDKAKVFEGGKLPEITIPEDAVNVGEYKVTLDKGVSKNYTIEYLPSYITVEPVLVKGVFTTIPVAAVGVEGQEILDNTVWSVEAADAADAATVENFSDQFELNIDESILDKDGKIKTEDGEDALFIVYTGSPENFVMDPETDSADLNIGGKDTEIALDDSAPVVTYESEKGTTVTFTQSRAVAEDKWQACVLPCTVSIEDFSNAFGYAAVDLFDKSRTNADEIHFSLQVTGNIEAGVPFLFKANKDNNFNEIEIENAEVANTADLNTVVEDDDTDIKFIGTFEGVNLTTAGYRYISKGSWYATKDGQAKPYVIKPLRAYLDLGTMFTGARIFIEEPDGTVTAIDTITLEDNNAEGMFNLSGMKVNQGLKGVYIQNGKKVIKK